MRCGESEPRACICLYIRVSASEEMMVPVDRIGSDRIGLRVIERPPYGRHLAAAQRPTGAEKLAPPVAEPLPGRHRCSYRPTVLRGRVTAGRRHAWRGARPRVDDGLSSSLNAIIVGLETGRSRRRRRQITTSKRTDPEHQRACDAQRFVLRGEL